MDKKNLTFKGRLIGIKVGKGFGSLKEVLFII